MFEDPERPGERMPESDPRILRANGSAIDTDSDELKPGMEDGFPNDRPDEPDPKRIYSVPSNH